MNTAQLIERNKKLGFSSMKLLLAAAFVSAVFAAAPVSAESLYPLDQPFGGGSQSLYTDARALQVGDPVTVIVSENITGSVVTSSKATNSGTATAGANGPSDSIAKTFGLDAGSTASSDGTTTHTGAMSATISALVAAVYNNGTLKLTGNREVSNNGVVESITFSGIVRRQDIAADNTVQSKNVAEASIVYVGRGEKKKKKLFGFITF
jgi:flagellar L-ring protein precursor FlgH